MVKAVSSCLLHRLSESLVGSTEQARSIQVVIARDWALMMVVMMTTINDNDDDDNENENNL